MRLSSLTVRDMRPHERLRVWRLRKNFTQTQAAEQLGVGLWEYEDMERGSSSREVPRPPWRGLFYPTPAEFCLLSRLRKGMTQGQVAEEIGLSRIWLNRMERGLEKAHKLVKYWEERTDVWES